MLELASDRNNVSQPFTHAWGHIAEVGVDQCAGRIQQHRAVGGVATYRNVAEIDFAIRRTTGAVTPPPPSGIRPAQTIAEPGPKSCPDWPRAVQ